MRHVNTRSRRLLALVPAAVLGLAVPVAAVSAASMSSAAAVRVAAPAASSAGAEPTDGATDGTGPSDDATDGTGDLCDPGVVPSAPAAPSSAATDTTQGTDGADDPTDNATDGTDGTDDGSGDTSCDDSHANLVGAVVRAAHARVKAGPKAQIPVKVTTARGTALATGKAFLFEGKKRIAVAQVAAGKVTFSTRHLSRGTHRLRVGLVSSNGSVVRAGATLTITVR